MRVLIVGGGQLGRSLQRTFGQRATIARDIDWRAPADARRAIDRHIRAFLGSTEEEWLLCWTAGAGVVSTSPALLDIERSYLHEALSTIESVSSDVRAGRLFLASSAGGIYGRNRGEECTESTPPSPMSAYGEHKLRQDDDVTDWARRTQVSTLIGRISNLYGPDLTPGKPQGFISHLCAAVANRRTFTLTVPSHTIRDFVYTDDVSTRVKSWAELADATTAGPTVKILAAQRSVTLGRVIGTTQRVSGAHVRVSLSVGPSGANQPRTLRFRSVVMPHLDDTPQTPLEAGIKAVWAAALRTRWQLAPGV